MIIVDKVFISKEVEVQLTSGNYAYPTTRTRPWSKFSTCVCNKHVVTLYYLLPFSHSELLPWLCSSSSLARKEQVEREAQFFYATWRVHLFGTRMSYVENIPVPMHDMYKRYLTGIPFRVISTHVLQDVIQISRKSILGKFSRYFYSF